MSSKSFLFCAALTAGVSATIAQAQQLGASEYQSIGLVNTLAGNIGNNGLLSSSATETGKYYLAGYSSLYAPTVGTSSALYAPTSEASFNGAWTDNSATSTWYTLSRDGDLAVDRLPEIGTFTTTLSFDLTGYQNVGFNIDMSFDDSIAVYLNGNLLTLTGDNAGRYSSLGLAYAITEGTTNNSYLNQGGVNTFRFEVTNSSGKDTSATGFRVEFSDLVGDASPVPEPSTYGLLLGAGALGVMAWRRRKRA